MTGSELRTWRTARHLSQHALAKLLNVSAQTVYRWEVGARKVHQFLPDRLARIKLKT